ncbi:TonB-dependent receptor [candidate division KSB1 bacterium]|nr:TonB-dependent receptor [candidate division KSB1 bacterium]
MKKRKNLICLLAALLLPMLAMASTTGKIKGKVVDRETNEPLPGANVVIMGTTYGTATDVTGEFVILNVPVGVYELKASYIGYREVKIENIRVNSGLTTELDFKLPSEALEVNAVTIVAERPLVNQNATNVTRIQSYDDFKNIPVRTVNSVVALQPGVVVQNGALFVRGGRNDEVGYYLEGANTRDQNNGNNAITVIPEALEEFQLQAGGYTAEFGGANAGILRQTLKSGGNDYRFSFQTETDNFTDRGETFLGTHSYGYTDYTATVSGPLLTKRLKFFFAGQNIFERDRATRFWKGFEFNHSDTYVDEHNFPLVLTTNREPRIEALIQRQGLKMSDNAIPASSRNQWIGNGTLVFDAKPLIFRLGGSFSFRRQDDLASSGTVVGSLVSRMFNVDRTQVEDLSTGLLNFKVTHLLGSKSFYEVNLNYFDRREVRYDPIFKHNFWAYWDSTSNAQEGVQFYDYAGLAPWRGGAQVMDIYGFDFVAPGTPANYTKNKRNYVGGSFAFNTQYEQHELKFGGSYERWTARNFSLDTQWSRTQLQAARQNPDDFRDAMAGDPRAVGAFRTLAGASQRSTYGYDTFGNELDVEGPEGSRHPYYLSFYAQDKFEARDLVINAGLRVDVMDNDDFVFADPTNPPWDRTNQGLFLDQLVKKEAAVEVSPRLGLAFPITERTVFHMQYGKFVQAPQFGSLYNGSSWFDALFTGGTSFRFNVVGLGLNPEKTTQYEVGFSQQFSDAAAFDLTAYYKNIEDQIQFSRVVVDPASPASDYNMLVNGDFATTAGVELSLSLRRTKRVAGQINYTFSRSLGTGSAANTAVAGIEQVTQVPTIISPLDFNRPQRGSASLDYRFAKGDGGPILQQLGLNLLMNFSSGHPYTRSEGEFGQQDASIGGQITDPRSRRPLEAVNASLTPWNFDLNLRLDKTVSVGRLGVNFYMYVQNLTNRQNVVNVYRRTGNAYDDGFLSNPDLSGPIIAANGGEQFIALYRAINLNGNGENFALGESDVLGLQLLGPPRQIRFGARLEF